MTNISQFPFFPMSKRDIFWAELPPAMATNHKGCGLYFFVVGCKKPTTLNSIIIYP